MSIEVDTTEGVVQVKAKLICAVLDLPAKAALLNCNQYNGAFGCSTCKHEGTVVSKRMWTIMYLIYTSSCSGSCWKRQV
jgi:hypothetical protein